MKKLLYLITILFLLSCKTEDNQEKIQQNIHIWSIKSFVQNDTEYNKDIIKDATIASNLYSGKTYITYLINGDNTFQLEEKWKKYDKKLRLDRIYVVQDITYIENGSEIELKNVDIDVVIEGEHTDKILEKLNHLIYTKRSNENEGLLINLYRLFKPSMINDLPIPKLVKGDKLKIGRDGEDISISNDTTYIKVTDEGLHSWLGF